MIELTKILLKARSLPQLANYRRAGKAFSPTDAIYEVTPEEAKAIEEDHVSIFSQRVTPDEAEAWRKAKAEMPAGSIEELATENVNLKMRLARLEEIIRERFGDDDFGDDELDDKSLGMGTGKGGTTPGSTRPGVAPGISPETKGAKRT